MDAQITTIVCPNCGANTTNHHNCEYCGSLLVRYTSENKTVDKDVFGKGIKVIPGLKEELKKNLAYQKIRKDDEVVVTTVTDSDDLVFQILETAHCSFGTVAENPFGGQYDRGVTLRIPFETRDEDSDYAEIQKARLAHFKQQDYYFLFKQQNLPTGVYYYIDFGEDIDNASKLISSIMTADDDETVDYTFETRMINSKSLVNMGGNLVDTTKDKAQKLMKISFIVCGIILLIYLVLRFVV